MKIHIPPKYDQYGNHQLWVVETEDGMADEIVNGIIFAHIVAGCLWMLVSILP